MFRPAASLAALPVSLWAAASGAQVLPEAAALQREVVVAHADAVAAAIALHDELVALAPSVPGWSCQEEDEDDGAISRWFQAIPAITLTCRNGGHSIKADLVLDPSWAEFVCKMGEDARETLELGIANGRVKPDALRVFEGGSWRLMRTFDEISGCAAGAVSLWGEAVTVPGETAAPDSAGVDALGQAIAASDPGPLLQAAETIGQPAALDRLKDLLEEQSRLLGEMIPAPDGATREVTPMMADEFVTTEFLAYSPQASAELEVGGCSIHVFLGAGPVTLYEALEYGSVNPELRDGEVTGLMVNRNTDRFVGQERLSGESIGGLVDGAVIVHVSQNDVPCEGGPDIVRQFFEDILANDLSAFARS